MAMSPEQGWGSWTETERWREDASKARSAAARLAWMAEVWKLREQGRIPVRD